MILAQLADLFDQTTWYLILGIGFGLPLMGFLMGWLLRGWAYASRRWQHVTVYYALAVVFWNGAMAGASVLACSVWLLWAAGPILGLFLAVSHPKPHYPPGRCRQCGYDLRASKDRCPECEMPVPPGHVAELKP